MLKMILCCLFSFCIYSSGYAQDFSAYQRKWLVQGADTMPYRVLYPLNYDTSKKYPLIFFLHGSGERGTDNRKQLTHGARLFLKEENRINFPAIIVFPQCSVDGYWSNVLRMHDTTSKREFYFIKDGFPTRDMQLLMELVNYVLAKYPINKQKIYVGGLSMGGMGTFELVRRMPGTFAAAFPICGGANPATAKALKNTSWWIFHGGKDDVVVPSHSQKMMAALKQNKSSVKFTLYPNANHNSWDSAFAEPGLLPWLFAQKRK